MQSDHDDIAPGLQIDEMLEGIHHHRESMHSAMGESPHHADSNQGMASKAEERFADLRTKLLDRSAIVTPEDVRAVEAEVMALALESDELR